MVTKNDGGCSLLCISTTVLLSRILNGYSLKYTLR